MRGMVVLIMFSGFRQDVVVVLILIAWWALVLTLPIFSVLNLVRRARAGLWSTPRWFLRLTLTSGYVGTIAWVHGALSTPFFETFQDACARASTDGENPVLFDRVHYEGNPEEYARIFPLHARCNAGFDFVPAWVNPTVGICFALIAAGLVGIVWTAVRRRRVVSRSEPGPSVSPA